MPVAHWPTTHDAQQTTKIQSAVRMVALERAGLDSRTLAVRCWDGEKSASGGTFEEGATLPNEGEGEVDAYIHLGFSSSCICSSSPGSSLTPEPPVNSLQLRRQAWNARGALIDRGRSEHTH